MGIGKRTKPHRYVTRLLLPQDVFVNTGQTDREHSDRQPSRPHLRRGHIRQQRYGHGLTEQKPIWIAPTFVNADEEFVSPRGAYRLQHRPKEIPLR
jgi:hypothetical protein